MKKDNKSRTAMTHTIEQVRAKHVPVHVPVPVPVPVHETELKPELFLTIPLTEVDLPTDTLHILPQFASPPTLIADIDPSCLDPQPFPLPDISSRHLGSNLPNRA